MRAFFIFIRKQYNSTMSDTSYPSAPANVPASATQPSAMFKRRIWIMIASLALFLVIYISLLALGVALAAALAIVGGAIIYTIHNLFVMILGAGLIVAGLMVLYFMVKFIFEIKKEDKTGYIEIFEEDHPRLFSFVRKVSEETGTKFPKHIYITHNVNAAVFYDSSFLSMFLPVRKNLVIGAGLVNMVNVSEFKAVIAHEFGHFSQKSMKAGSYVYQVNKVIYNMLAENDSYHNILIKWANIHSAFALCARLTFSIVKGVQWVQRQSYIIVNKQYSALSREMEYHADAVAASVAGSNNCIAALYRIEFADTCYDMTLSKYNDWLREDKKSSNAFADQRTMGSFMAQERNFSIINGLPVIDYTSLKSSNKVSVVNVWASHPTIPQREEALKQLNIEATTINNSAWELFNAPAQVQQMLTSKLYDNAPMADKLIAAADAEFHNIVQQEKADAALPSIYSSFYQYREISSIDLVAAPKDHNIKDLTTFYKEKAALTNELYNVREDISLLSDIIEHKHIKHFTFEGDKMSRRHAAEKKSVLEEQQKQLGQTLSEADQDAYYYFLEKAGAISDTAVAELKTYYRYYYKIAGIKPEKITFVNQALDVFNNLYSGALITDKIINDLDNIKATLKQHITDTQQIYSSSEAPYRFDTPADIMRLHNYHYNFRGSEETINESINNLNELTHRYANWLFELHRKALKALLEKQLTYL